MAQEYRTICDPSTRYDKSKLQNYLLKGVLPFHAVCGFLVYISTEAADFLKVVGTR